MDGKGEALAAAVDVGVVGAGSMGAGIAQVAVLAGHRVRLFDTCKGAARAAIEGIAGMLDKLVAKERLSSEAAAKARANLQPLEELGGFAGTGLVIEAIVEDLQAKRTLFRSLEEVTGKATILATNTSSISVTAIGSALRHPERLAGMHFFNPAPLMPLVEIIRGAASRGSVIDTLFHTAEAWGKVPVRARSTPGFIVNRVARPFYAEALRVLNEGGADCATIDAILRETGGFRMGPFELMDLIGNDVNYAVTRSVFDAFYGDARFTPSLLQLELVEAGFLGRKTGRGFYMYGEDAASPAPSSALMPVPPDPPPSQIVLHGSDAVTEALAQRLSNAAVPFSRSGLHADLRLAQCDGAVIYLTDGRTATERAAFTGIADTLHIDLTLNAAKAARLALTVADQAAEGAYHAGAGLFEAAGYKVSRVDDLPGMIVMRTVAMLANEAADAVNQRVCNARDVDLAMRKGVNYPLGPLEWADAIGLSRVVEVLDHMARSYGESRYRVSPLLRRKLLAGGSFAL